MDTTHVKIKFFAEVANIDRHPNLNLAEKNCVGCEPRTKIWWVATDLVLALNIIAFTLLRQILSLVFTMWKSCNIHTDTESIESAH